MAIRRINGWHRLWILLTVLYGIVVGLIAQDDAPSRNEIIRSWANELDEVFENAHDAGILEVMPKETLLARRAYLEGRIQSEEDGDEFPKIFNEEMVRIITKDAKNIDLANLKDVSTPPLPPGFVLDNQSDVINGSSTIKNEAEKFKKTVLDLETKYRAQLDKLPQDQLNFYLSCLSYWLIPSLVLLFLGQAIAWVIRGFRRG